MKKILFLVLVLAAAGFAYWPYSVSSQVRDAVNEGDETGLDKVVDWSILRVSVREQVKPLTDEALRRQYGANLPRVEALVPSDGILNKVLDEEINSKGFIRLAKGKTATGEGQKVSFETRSWNGMTGFDMTLSGSEIRYHLEFKGGDGWKLVDAKLGAKDGEALVAKFNVAMAASAKQNAAAVLPPPPKPKPESWLKNYQNPLDAKPSSTEHKPGGGGGRR